MIEIIKNALRQLKSWHVILIGLGLLASLILTVSVNHAQDEEMRENLLTYALTIENSIDWTSLESAIAEHAAQKPANESIYKIPPEKLADIKTQMRQACNGNKQCHFIYLVYSENSQVKFLLDASDQPASEISAMHDIFDDASEVLKHAIKTQRPEVGEKLTDHWGTWVSAFVPVASTIRKPHFVMLGIDVAVADWDQYMFKKTIVPIITTLLLLSGLVSLIFQNISRKLRFEQLSRQTSELIILANNDVLTGLPNRRLLEDRVAQAIKTAARAQNIVAVLFLDLDYFKNVNDVHGHAVGDLLLKQVAQRLTALLRAEDTVARVGGDEFVIVLPHLSEETQATNTANKILTELSAPFEVQQKILQIGTSVGIAFYHQQDEEIEISVESLIDNADGAMYVAKRKGRNCYAIYEA
jgi:diguanylate cyclase (GGDEF)-like protein